MTNSIELFKNTEDNYQALAALSGASNSTTNYLPRLRVNRNAIDDDGNDVPMGTYAITQDETTFYGKSVLFRPYINSYQYSRYDPKERKTVNRSIIIKNFYEEAVDMLGGLSCGKISAKLRESLSQEQQEDQKKIKCARLMYGTVTMLGAKTFDGTKTDITDLPVVFKLGGGNFMCVQDSLKAMDKMKHLYTQHNLELTLSKPKKAGDTIYYEVLVNLVLDPVLNVGEDVVEIFHMFQENIDRENKYVTSKWAEAKRGAVKAVDIQSELAFDFDDGVSDV